LGFGFLLAAPFLFAQGQRGAGRLDSRRLAGSCRGGWRRRDRLRVGGLHLVINSSCEIMVRA
ncbi:MAG TPA: hypothetical protein VM187_00265, partial [Niastella sp.]|nr:hypothetical protein [Niastella sp.]